MPRKAKKRTVSKMWRFVAVLCVIVAMIPLAFAGMVWLGAFGPLPEDEELRKLESFTAARILDKDGQLLGFYYVQNRTQTTIRRLPPHLVNALVATEDARFYRHSGIDGRSLLRVAFRSILLGDRTAGGGSTISQQLAKNLFPRKKLGILTIPAAKARELIIARRLEKIYSKDQILELYLNTVSFGENTYGIETASLTFFSKEPSKLRIEESALLVGLLKASSAYNPRLKPEASRDRRNVVLDQMRKYEYLSGRQCDSLQRLPLRLNYRKFDHVSGPAPYFREFIRQEAGRLLAENNGKTGMKYNLYTDGLTIKTTLDLDLQEQAEIAAGEHIAWLQKAFLKSWEGKEPWRKDITLASHQITMSQAYQSLKEKGLDHQEIIKAMKVKRKIKVFSWAGPRDTLISPLDSILYHFGMVQCGLVAVDPASGAVRAWIGGDDFGYFKYDHVTSHRQTGSAFKPIVYAAALEQGMAPCTLFSNEAEIYKDYQDWSPRNYDNKYDGYYSLQGALVHSVNTVSVKVLMETGIDHVIGLSRMLGIEGKLPEMPSLALGSAETSLLDMTRAYAVFLNQGKAVRPYTIESITDRNGKVIYRAKKASQQEEVISPLTAEVITGMLEAVVERGTASKLRTRWNLTGALAGKTGTTSDQSDGWFIGMTPSLVIGVWAGGDYPVVRFRNGSLGAGANSAMPVFARLIRSIERNRNIRDYARGEFAVAEEIREMLSCIDFNERKGLRKTARPATPAQPAPRYTPPPKQQPKEKGVKKFFKKLFGGKNDKR